MNRRMIFPMHNNILIFHFIHSLYTHLMHFLRYSLRSGIYAIISRSIVFIDEQAMVKAMQSTRQSARSFFRFAMPNLVFEISYAL